MVTIRTPDGDFDVQLKFTNLSSVTKDTENDEINLIGGFVTYFDNGQPNRATFVLETTPDSIWIDELFDVELKTKSPAEGTWLYRFTGRTERPVINFNRVTISCRGDLFRVGRRYATKRWFFDTLYDQNLFETKTGTPKYVDLNAAKRPMRPLIEVEYQEALRNMFDVADAAWYHIDDSALNAVGQTFYVTKRQTVNRLKFKMSHHSTGDPDFDYKVSITNVKLDAANELVPDEASLLASSAVLNDSTLTAGAASDVTETISLTTDLELEPYKRYGIYIEVLNVVNGALHVRVDVSNPAEPFARGSASTLIGSTWTAAPTINLWFWVYGTSDDHWTTLREGIDFNVDYKNKKINFDYADVFDPILFEDVIRATYFGGYPTITNIITALHDDYLSDFTDSSTINPTANLDIRPFKVEESTINALLRELMKLGPWSTRLYKNTSGNFVFEFTDSYVPSDWGSAPFTGAFQTNRNFYYGGEVSPPAGSIRIVDDERRKIGDEKVTLISAINPDADLVISIVDPVGKSDYGRMGFPTVTVKVADNLDELVEFVEFLFQIHSQQIIRGEILVDKVSMTTANAMLTHCNDLIYIKDGRVGFDGAFKLTRIVLNLDKWDFRLTVTNARPSIAVDDFMQESGYLMPAGELGFLNQSAFSAPKGKIETRADWGLTRKVIGLEDSSVDYSASHTYKIGVGDSAATGTVMQNELAKVTCEVHETTGKIHLLDLDGDGTDEYRVAIAIFDRDDFPSNQSWPVTIKEAALYDDATVLKRYRFETPWPASPATYDYFHPFVSFSNDDKLYVCFVISIP